MKRLCRYCKALFDGRPEFVYCTAVCGAAHRAILSRRPQRPTKVPREYPPRPVPTAPLTDAERRIRRHARSAVRYALETGRLTRGACEQDGRSCEGPIEAHHDDYSRPLAVRWLCRAHHRQADSRKFARFGNANGSRNRNGIATECLTMVKNQAGAP